MSDRDRKILLAVIPFVVIVAYWFLLLAPTRKEASTASAQAAKQEQRRDAAKAEAASAASAKTDFRSDYTQIVRLGKAIPAQVDMPSLLVQLDGAAKGTGIHFTKITRASAPRSLRPPPREHPRRRAPRAPRPRPRLAASPPRAGPVRLPRAPTTPRPSPGVDATTSTTAREGSLPVGGGEATTTADGEVVAAPVGLETVPLEMEFVGDFFHLADFFHDVKRFVHVANQNVIVNGRLVTIDSVSYASDPLLFPRLRATIKATVYLSPKTEGATAGATPEGPAATTPATTPAATPAPAATPRRPDRHGDPIGNVMKVFLLDLWHDLKEKRLWPVAVVLLVALVAVPVLLAKPATKSSAPAPVATAAGPKPDVLKQLAKVKLGDDEVGDGSTLGVFNPLTPSPRRRAPSRSRRPGTATAGRHRATPARRVITIPPCAGGGTPRARSQPWQHRRWRHPRRRTTDHDDDGLQVRGRPDLHGQRPHAAHQGHGKARHAAEPDRPAADLHGRHAQGLERRVPRGLDA